MQSVQVLDDDLAISSTDLADGFEAWRQYGRGQRIVGFTARAAIPSGDGRTYSYHTEPENSRFARYNMVLSNAAFIDRIFLRAYWLPAAAPIRQIVEDLSNVRRRG